MHHRLEVLIYVVTKSNFLFCGLTDFVTKVLNNIRVAFRQNTKNCHDSVSVGMQIMVMFFGTERALNLVISFIPNHYPWELTYLTVSLKVRLNMEISRLPFPMGMKIWVGKQISHSLQRSDNVLTVINWTKIHKKLWSVNFSDKRLKLTEV